jgi:hypothetical protein
MRRPRKNPLTIFAAAFAAFAVFSRARADQIIYTFFSSSIIFNDLCEKCASFEWFEGREGRENMVSGLLPKIAAFSRPDPASC